MRNSNVPLKLTAKARLPAHCWSEHKRYDRPPAPLKARRAVHQHPLLALEAARMALTWDRAIAASPVSGAGVRQSSFLSAAGKSLGAGAALEQLKKTVRLNERHGWCNEPYYASSRFAAAAGRPSC